MCAAMQRGLGYIFTSASTNLYPNTDDHTNPGDLSSVHVYVNTGYTKNAKYRHFILTLFFFGYHLIFTKPRIIKA